MWVQLQLQRHSNTMRHLQYSGELFFLSVHLLSFPCGIHIYLIASPCRFHEIYIGDKGAAAIAEALKINKALAKLE